MLKLTDLAVRKLKPGLARREIHGGGGLYLVVQPSGAKSFALRYKRNGRTVKLTLGSSEIGLAKARKLAADAKLVLAEKRDPAEEKRREKLAARAEADAAADTFKAISEEWVKREAAKMRSGERRARDLRRLVYPKLGARPIADIKRSEIVRLLDHVEDENGAAMSNAVLALVGQVCSWHETRSDDFRSPVIKGMRRTKLSARERILSDDELRAVWKAAGATADPFGSVVKLLLLTSARRNEVASMKWAEIDGAGNWTLPAARHKLKSDLTRPLSAAAREVIARLPKIVGCDFLFSGDGARPLGHLSKRKAQLDGASGTSGWTIHDLRRTARSLMSRAGVAVDVAERCLGHTIGGVRGVYDQHKYQDEMRHGFEALSSLIQNIVDPQPNVVPIKAKAQG